MPKPDNAMEIFKLLDKSNCRECGEKTCLAFAGAVFTGGKRLAECPKLDPEILERYAGETGGRATPEQLQAEYMGQLKSGIAGIDLAAAAERAGGRFSGGRLTLKVLGKDFSVDKEGNLFSDIHVNLWVAIPFLSYVLHGRGLTPSGNWVSFRNLKDGRERYPLFHKRCEEPIKQVADRYTGFFDDIVHIFNGRQVERQFESDISAVLHPLPKVPVMVCYWLPEGGLESSLNLFFDKTADDNIGADSVFTLGVGLSEMFGRLALRHGVFENTLNRE